MEKLNVAVIGLGSRGIYLSNSVLLDMDKCEITAICDVYEDRIDRMLNLIKSKRDRVPFATTDYHKILTRDDVDAVLITASWEVHTSIAIDAMRAGKAVGLEVGGAYSVEECFELVRTQVETKTPFMFLENCIFGREELAVLNMVKHGLFGEIVNCEGGYEHDLRNQILTGVEMRHYRFRNYKNRNCDNYPTHQLGPIARVLDINRGNRMLYVTSMASKAVSLNDYAALNPDKYNSEYATLKFNQGDVVTTNIMCANGATICLKLNTTCSRPYSRNFIVQGTRGHYNEDGKFFFFDDSAVNGLASDHPELLNNQSYFIEKYEHPIWQKFLSDGVRGGHGGMDWLLIDAFCDYVLNGGRSPIDVYDAAMMMCITPLTEQSIREGSRPVEIPDFTIIK